MFHEFAKVIFSPKGTVVYILNEISTNFTGFICWVEYKKNMVTYWA